MALLQKGCCCCELRTCVLIQAWVGLLVSVLHLAAGMLLIALMADLIPVEELPEFLRPKPMSIHTNRKVAAAAIRDMKVAQALQGSILILTGLINLPITIALIYGCKKENRRLLVPTLIWSAFAMLFLIIMSIITIIATSAKVAAVVALVCVPLTGLSIYFWLHILSYYLELREEDRELKRQTL